MYDTCIVCCSEDLPKERGIVPCNHDSVCGSCHTRLRYLHNDLRCPVCKVSNDRVIVDADNVDMEMEEKRQEEEKEQEEERTFHKSYEDYAIWGDDEIGQDFVLREDVRIFYRKSYHDDKIVPLFQYACTEKGCSFVSKKGMRGLKDHLRTKHTKSFCTLCVDAKRDFVSRLPRFRPEQLKYHMSKGDGKESGFKGHPICEFCRPKRFYDLTKLHEHLNKEHYKCHVCERQNIHNQFFKNYEKLELHFDKKHFLCHDPQCLAARFVVFDNEIDLRAHELSTHGRTSQSNGSTKINLEFRVRRTGFDGSGYELEQQELPSEDDFQFGLNGEAFVPESLPAQLRQQQQQQQQEQQQHQQQNEPDISDPIHAARTAEMRAQAAEIRNRQNASESQTEEAFPVLRSENGSSSQPLVGWTAQGRQVIRNGRRNVMSQEAFPALQSSTNSLPTRNIVSNGRSRVQPKKKVNQAFSNVLGASTTVPLPSTNVASARTQSHANGINRTSNLSSDKFPSLGGSSNNSTNTYASAKNFAKKLQTSTLTTTTNTTTRSSLKKSAISATLQPKPARIPTASEFPTLGGGPSTYAAAEQFAKQQKTVRQKAFGPTKINGSTAQVLAQNVLLPPTPATKMDPKEQLSALKSILGSSNYKQLKKLTVQFASNRLAHEQYIDSLSNCFPEGKRDADFWNFVPSLVESCPDEGDGRNGKALEYLATIRIAADIEEGYMPGSAMSSSSLYTPPSSVAATAMSRPKPPVVVPRYAHPSPSVQTTKFKNGKKAAVWGSGSTVSKTTSVLSKSKLPPGTSVAKDALNETTQRGSATKYMAKMNLEEKKIKKQQNGKGNASGNGGGKKSKATKKKNELRNLAFGR